MMHLKMALRWRQFLDYVCADPLPAAVGADKVLSRYKKAYWQALTGDSLLNLPFGLLFFWLKKHT
jgi:hypothetical protein